MKKNGQVAIMVLLISAVMLTLGLSMSKKEMTNIKIATNDELLKKAFDTAESGINFYLGTGGVGYSSPDNNSFATVNTTTIGVGQSINFGEYTPQASSENYWLVDHLVDGSMGTTYFGGPNVDVCGPTFTGQAEVAVFSRTALKRNLIDMANNCVTVEIVASPVLVVVTPLLSGGKFYIQANTSGSFSSQGTDIVAQGSSGGTNKKLSVRQRYKLPGFLTSGIMAEGAVRSE